MNYRIVTDSSANITSLEGAEFSYVPLHITVNGTDFIDAEGVDLAAMQAALKTPKCHSSTACPGPDDWIKAFGDAQTVFVITITSELSGSCASANIAKGIYEDEHPGRKVFIFDSLSTGPEMVLLAERIHELVKLGFEPEQIELKIKLYALNTHLYFSLGSINNLANNGRVNALLAKGVGLLGMRILGRASDVGKLQPMDKCRGDRKALMWLVKQLHECGYSGGKIILSHTDNESAALELKKLIEDDFGDVGVRIMPNTALCAYYAEPLSVLMGFET